MKQIQLFLVPQPGAKPEFLASLQLVDPGSPAVLGVWKDKLPGKLVLEGYTRDGWAWKPTAGGSFWITVTVQSTDGRNKLGGFTKYLQQRQKAAFGRFSPAGLVVVSYIQPKSVASDPNQIECRIAVDLTKIPNCPVKPKQAPPSRPPAVSGASAKGKKGGLLGKLVGAQHRTNHHVAVANSKPKRVAKLASTSTTSPASGGGDAAASAATAAAAAAAAVSDEQPTRTAEEVLSDFRQDMADKMLDFDISSEEVLKVKISENEYRAGLSEEDKSRVNMDILKFMVYEAAEEVNEEWVAIKEPSEFLDEATFAVYKEGAAPDDVLEELNRGDLPDEVKGQQQALQQERIRQMDHAEQRKQAEAESQAHKFGQTGGSGSKDNVDQVEALNSGKRDRRTLEDFEREKTESGKKARVS